MSDHHTPTGPERTPLNQNDDEQMSAQWGASGGNADSRETTDQPSFGTGSSDYGTSSDGGQQSMPQYGVRQEMPHVPYQPTPVQTPTPHNGAVQGPQPQYGAMWQSQPQQVPGNAWQGQSMNPMNGYPPADYAYPAQQPPVPSQMPMRQYPNQPMQQYPSLPLQEANRQAYIQQMKDIWMREEQWMSSVRKRMSRVGWALTISLVVWLIGTRLLTILLEYLPQSVLVQFLDLWSYLVSVLGQYGIAVPLAMLVLAGVPTTPVRKFDMSPGRFFSLLVMCFPLMIGGSIIGQLLSALLTGGVAINRIESIIAESNPWITLLFTVIVAPLGEEWFFRKQIIDRTRRFGEKTSVLFSALAFGLYHVNLFQFFYAFALGAILGYAYIRTSKLRYSVLIHMLINLQGGVIGPMILQNMGSINDDAELANALARGDSGVVAYAIYLMCMLGLAIAGTVLLIVNRRKWEWYSAPEELPQHLRKKAIFGNAGVIVFIVVAILLNLYML
ncbi:CPBP family intramembrane glutamic endopeptidase [Bifidobacterium tsurumiense]|uniref:CPBP family intramembrane glutamic endopeptidase n=1 Tax=Bifidobacterium tsurumiense TaxID=356829 RepID=UPI0012B2164E|nr:type II CAAX endopeptidase family protein [Bifidobacterium tsurumiense]MSS13222.1 CPBP family intramembrane metalloprotease [Bifidobacterium tsurumiense]